MNKQAARKQALAGAVSIGELRAAINDAITSGRRISRVNPQFTLIEACRIYTAALEGRDDAEVPAALRPDPYSRSGAMKPTRDVLLITNILRDCD